MANRLLFDDWLMAHFLASFRCTACKSTEPLCVLQYPTIQTRGTDVVLRFPITCSCGRATIFSFRLPILLFGFLLARQAIIDADRRGNRSKASMRLIGATSGLVPHLVFEYRRLMRGLSTLSPSGPTSDDQEALALTDSEWREFLKRMGFDGGTAADA